MVKNIIPSANKDIFDNRVVSISFMKIFMRAGERHGPCETIVSACLNMEI